jgi:tetratricopeptide (TPR) repeat protein
MGKRSFITYFKKLPVTLLLTLVFLEMGLRADGFIASSWQEHKNLQALKQKKAYCILCLGESTTQNQYPRFLKEALDQRNTGTRFSVVDEGRIETNTAAILKRIETCLDQYHPDMVVAMMGIKDGLYSITDEKNAVSPTALFLRSFRIYKLARLVWLRILAKARGTGLYKFTTDKQLFGKIQAYLPGSGFRKTYTEPISTEALLKKAIELDPKNDNAYFGLGRLYMNQGRSAQAEKAFSKAIELNPGNDNAYFGLGWFYQEQGQSARAEGAFQKALALDPKNDKAYFGLGRFYHGQGQFPEAEEAFKKAIELNPQNDVAHFELGRFYQEQGKFPQAEDAFKRSLELNSKNYAAYFQLGWFYQEQGKFSQAENAFKKAIELNPENDNAYRTISIFYDAIGKLDLAKEYARKAGGSRPLYYNPATAGNYRKLKEILDKRGVKLVCAQYPMRNAELLKKIFEEDTGVIFVDNQKVFKDAVDREGYKACFSDMFGGDFGHCTEKGNRLLAGNIADVILKEVFNK